jgi:hypothetical protein
VKRGNEFDPYWGVRKPARHGQQGTSFSLDAIASWGNNFALGEIREALGQDVQHGGRIE